MKQMGSGGGGGGGLLTKTHSNGGAYLEKRGRFFEGERFIKSLR